MSSFFLTRNHLLTTTSIDSLISTGPDTSILLYIFTIPFSVMSIKSEPDLSEVDNTFDPLVTSESEEEDESDNYEDFDGFKVSRALPRYEERKHTTRDLMHLLDTPNGIYLSPAYQREFVWNDERQTGLVNSLFHGYFVPGLIFNRRVEVLFGSVRKESLICIDGKQRLNSVKRFTEGLIPCLGADKKAWWFRRSDDKLRSNRSYLSQAAKAEFWAKKFSCYEYVGMSDAQEHELFQRVQRGDPLTLAEIAQAQQGEWQELARTFQKDFVRVAKCKCGNFIRLRFKRSH